MKSRLQVFKEFKEATGLPVGSALALMKTATPDVDLPKPVNEYLKGDEYRDDVMRYDMEIKEYRKTIETAQIAFMEGEIAKIKGGKNEQ